MTNPLFTLEDVENLRDFDNFLVMPRKTDVPYWMEDLANRIQQWLDQQASGAVVSFGPGHYTITAATRSGEHAFTVPLSVIDPTVIHETDLEEG